ncbi:phage holin family protein [Specibacter cremeus]|uniref:phage holin family protein n=1 Tax=Specibacter cremeus TaxID=1629051 RepID=UPI001F0C86E7|nr:phage holin family protein [Specibacter cremeus]
MASASHNGHGTTGTATQGLAGLLDTMKTAARLLPLQANDQLSLAKEELRHKGKRAGVAAAFLAVALVFLCLLVIGLVVAAIAGLATVMPLWLSALLVSAAFLVILAACALVGARKLEKALPLKPSAALHGIRYDLGVLKEGELFDPATLEPEQLTKEEIKARKARKAADAAKAKAEREAKAAEHGPAATEAELKKRTDARRHHLLVLRTELLAQADVRRQAAYFGDQAREAVTSRLKSGPVWQVLDGAKGHWVSLGVLAGAATAVIVLLRKLLRS